MIPLRSKVLVLSGDNESQEITDNINTCRIEKAQVLKDTRRGPWLLDALCI